MRRVIPLLLLPLLSTGCGSSPTSPTPTAGPSSTPLRMSFGLTFAPDAVAGVGWSSPTVVTLRPGIGSSVPLEKAVFRMSDEGGETLAEATIAADGPVPPDGYFDASAIVQTLSWPAERGNAKRLDILLTVRGTSGEFSTISFSYTPK